KELVPMLRPFRRAAFDRTALAATLKLGLPIGIQVSVEGSTFAVVSVCAGWFGSAAMAGHQVAINFASLSFMVPSGIGSAASVLVGHAIGEQDAPHARRVAASALLCGGAFMAMMALVMLAFPKLLAGAYTSVPEVAAVAAQLIPIAGIFQIFDGQQVVAAGVLRGAGDTRASML